MLRHHFSSLAAAVAVTAMASAALAQYGPPGGGTPPPKPKIACAADIQRLCPNLGPDRKAFKQCLKAHRAEVSPGCSASLQYVREMKRQRQAAGGQPGGPAPGDMPPPSGGMQPPH